MAEPGTWTGAPGDWWTVFALVPDVLEHAVAGFGLYQSPKRRLDPVLRELGQIRSGWAAGSQFVFSQHCKSLRDLGVAEEKTSRSPIGRWHPATARLSASSSPTPTAWSGPRHDALFGALQDQLGDVEILELTYITTLYSQHAVMSRALRTEFDDRDDPIVEVPGPEGASALHRGPSTSSHSG